MVRLLGAIIVVESIPAMTGKLVMHGKKSSEIQTPVLLIVIARPIEVSRTEHRHTINGKGLSHRVCILILFCPEIW